MSTETPYRPPRSKPGHQSLEKILVAAENQLRQEELDLFTIDRVLERAGVSTGSFYARFPEGKQALLNAVQDRLYERIQPAIMKSLDALDHKDKTLDEAVDHVFGSLIAHMLREREIIRAFMMFSAFDPVIRRKGYSIYLERRDAVAEVLLIHRDEIAHPDPLTAIYLAFAVFQSLIHGRFMFFVQHPELGFGVNNEEIYEEIKLWISSYLHGVRVALPAQVAKALVSPH